MKYLFLFIIILNVNYAKAQDSITLHGKQYVMDLVDSAQFDIHGWWKIIDKQFLWDNGRENPKKWNGEGYGDYALFSDNFFSVYSSGGFGIRIINPKYEKKYRDSIHEECEFNLRYKNKLLVVSLYEKQDTAKMYEQESTYLLFVLNKNTIVIFYNNTATYLMRSSVPPTNDGWHTEADWTVIKYKEAFSTFRTFLPDSILRVRKGYLQFKYYPKPSCKYDEKINMPNSYLDISCITQWYLRKDYSVFKQKTVSKKIIEGYIPLVIFKNNIMDVSMGSCSINEEWKFMWRIVDDTAKTVKIKPIKSFIYTAFNTPAPTKMYLLKNDEVEVLEEKNNWLHIRYYGKKIVEGWIKKTDVQ